MNEHYSSTSSRQHLLGPMQQTSLSLYTSGNKPLAKTDDRATAPTKYGPLTRTTYVLAILIPVTTALNLKTHGIRIDVTLVLLALLTTLPGSARQARAGRLRLYIVAITFSAIIAASALYNPWLLVSYDARLLGMTLLAFLLYRRISGHDRDWQALTYGILLASASAALQVYTTPLDTPNIVFQDNQGFTRVITTEGPVFLVSGAALAFLLLVSHSAPRRLRLGLLLTTIISMIELFRTQTRGYIFAVAIVIVLLLPAAIKHSLALTPKRPRRAAAQGIRLVLGIVVALGAALAYLNRTLSSGSRTSIAPNSSIQLRIDEIHAQISQQGWDIGVGRGLGGQFRTPIGPYPSLLTTWAHNGFMWWSLKLGAAIGAYVGYATFVRPLVYLYGPSRSTYHEFNTTMSAAIGLLSVGVISLTSNQFTLYGGAYLLGACSGIISRRQPDGQWKP